jgi:hypothetical protein
MLNLTSLDFFKAFAIKMILPKKRLGFAQPLYHFHRSNYSWQVASQQSRLPLGLTL